MTRRRNRSTHRIAWAVAAVALLVAMGVAFLRESNRTVTAPGPSLAVLKEAMFTALEDDPNAWQTRTRTAVEQVASRAEAEGVHTAETRYALALRLMGEGRHAESAAAYREAIALRPDWARPHNGLGIVLFRQGNTAEAYTAFEQAKDLEPDWGRPYNDLAVLLRGLGRMDEAREMAEMALELDPDSVAAHNNYGNLLKELGDLEGAERAYHRAIESDPNHPSPRYNLACLHSLRGNLDLALARLHDAIDREPAFRDEAMRDPDFDPIRDEPAFQALIEGRHRDGDRGR